MAFPIEQISLEATLFRRIPRAQVVDGRVSSAAYGHERLSVNWEKYSNAASTADENCDVVTALISSGCIALGLGVEHTPVQLGEIFGPNQAHSEICGKKTNAIKQKLRDLAQEVWRRTT